MNRNVGKKLKKLRLYHGLSQLEMSEKINLSQSTYSRFERGDSKTWIHYIEIICQSLCITQEELLHDERPDYVNPNPKLDAENSDISSDKISVLYENLLLEKEKNTILLEKLLDIKEKYIKILEEKNP